MSKKLGCLLTAALVLAFVGVGCGSATKPDEAAQKPNPTATPVQPAAPVANEVVVPPSRPGATAPVIPVSARTVAAPSPETLAASWPQFHGPRGDNISTETGLLQKWPEGGPKLLWTCPDLGDGFGSPSIDNGLIFVSGAIDGKTVVSAIDLLGKPQWRTPLNKSWAGQYPGERGTPTIEGDRLYYESPMGEVVCLNAKTGKNIWGVNILQEFDGKNITWGLAESVVLDGNHVLCCPGGKKASVAALDKRTGKTVWTTPSTGDLAGYATAVFAEFQGVRMLLTMNQRAVIGVRLDDGALLFRHLHETQYDVNATSPTFHDGQIFVTSGYRAGAEMIKLRLDGAKMAVDSVWKSQELDNHHGGVILWQGYLYGAAHQRNGGRWICLAWQDGAEQYKEKGVGKGSLTYADNMFYCWSEKGRVGLVPAVPEKHEPVSTFEVAKGGEGPTWAHPVVCGGRLYLRHGQMLHCYDIHAGK